jgi:hypothetical protein
MHFWPYTIQMITDTDTDGRTDAGYFPRARSHPFSAMISYLRKLIVLFFQRIFVLLTKTIFTTKTTTRRTTNDDLTPKTNSS